MDDAHIRQIQQHVVPVVVKDMVTVKLSIEVTMPFVILFATSDYYVQQVLVLVHENGLRRFLFPVAEGQNMSLTDDFKRIVLQVSNDYLRCVLHTIIPLSKYIKKNCKKQIFSL